MNRDELFEEVMKQVSELKKINAQDIPAIDLYMDQVTTFMDSMLKGNLLESQEDHVLTKTMINNYAKNKLIPAPQKKKYTKEHMMLLILIYYMKGVTSINDIQDLLNPITEKYYGKEEGLNLGDVYQEVFSLEDAEIEHLVKELKEKYQIAGDTFNDAPEGEQDYLRTFSFICLLSFDVYIKRALIDKMIHSMTEDCTEVEKKAEESKNDKKKNEENKTDKKKNVENKADKKKNGEDKTDKKQKEEDKKENE